MKKRILSHLKYMDNLIQKIEQENVPEQKELQNIYEHHMNQISFFMHERLIHLIVTALFAIGTFMTVFTFLLTNEIGLLILALLLIILLIPYISHYYLLENSVQKMYEQYDKLQKVISRS